MKMQGRTPEKLVLVEPSESYYKALTMNFSPNLIELKNLSLVINDENGDLLKIGINSSNFVAMDGDLFGDGGKVFEVGPIGCLHGTIEIPLPNRCIGSAFYIYFKNENADSIQVQLTPQITMIKK
jgi:hypothetical protein